MKFYSLNLVSALRFYNEAITINSIHSPLMYSLISHLFDLKKDYYDDYKIEQLRKRLLKDKSFISFVDLGAKQPGISKRKVNRRICDLAKTSSSNRLKCKLIRNIITFFRPLSILELGTNLGISTAYLHSSAKSARLVSVEGVEEIYVKAKENLASLDFKKCHLINMDFDSFFRSGEDSILNSELVYLDGNHAYESTMHYFKSVWKPQAETRIIIVDDINWSEGMASAWNEMKKSPGSSSLDFYKIGILFRDERLTTPMHIKCVPRFLKPWKLGVFG